MIDKKKATKTLAVPSNSERYNSDVTTCPAPPWSCPSLDHPERLEKYHTLILLVLCLLNLAVENLTVTHQAADKAIW